MMKFVEDFLSFILGSRISQFGVRTSEICHPQDRPTDGSAQETSLPISPARAGTLQPLKMLPPSPARAPTCSPARVDHQQPRKSHKTALKQDFWERGEEELIF